MSNPTVAEFLAIIDKYKLDGLPYVLGTQTFKGVKPRTLDCSEAVEFMTREVGLDDFAKDDPTAAVLYNRCNQVSVAIALKTPGALVFKHQAGYKPREIHHVGVVHYIKDRVTWIFEAKGRAYGVIESKALDWSDDPKIQHGWNLAGLIPGLVYPGRDVPKTDGEKKEG